MTQPTTPEAAAEEISVRLFVPGDEPMTRIIQGILAKHYAAQAAEIERLERERDGWIEAARQYSHGREYYQSLLDQIATNFGEAAYTSDDGSVQQDPLRAKMPELVAAHVAEQRQEIAANELQIADLAQLVRRLLHRTSPELIHKIDGLNKLREQAQDYLNRKGLQGSILREESP